MPDERYLANPDDWCMKGLRRQKHSLEHTETVHDTETYGKSSKKGGFEDFDKLKTLIIPEIKSTNDSDAV